VYVPFPVLPFRVKCVLSITVITKVPLAAVFPPTPNIMTVCPVTKELVADVVIWIGDVLVAALTLDDVVLSVLRAKVPKLVLPCLM
jgi:hypothetical protein